MGEHRTDFHTQFFALQRDWQEDGIPILTASVSLPAPEGTDRITCRIRRYYRLQSRAYLHYCEHQLLPLAKAAYRAALADGKPLPCARAELESCVTYCENGLWSLYTQSRESVSSGQLLVRRWGDTWDLRTGYPLPLGGFFASRQPWKRHILAHTAAEIERQLRSGTAQYREDWRRRLRRAFNPRNFYLTPEGLVFFFPMYAIAPAVERVPVFLLPRGTEGLLFPSPPEESTAAE